MTSFAAHNEVVLAPRGAPGRYGRSIMVDANAYRVTAEPSKTFYHYDEFETAKFPKAKRIVAVHILQQFKHPDIFNPPAIFDGVANMYSYQDFPADGTYEVNLNHREPRLRPNNINLTITKVAAVSPSDWTQVLNGQRHTDLSLTFQQILNILVRQAAIVNLPVKGNSFYTRDVHQEYKHLEIWRGYYQSVRPSPGKMFVNIDISTGVMYAGTDLVDFAMKLLGVNNARDLYRLSGPSTQWDKLRSVLRRVRVQCSPGGEEHIIEGLEPHAGMYQFDKDGEAMTVEIYFRRFKNVTLKYPKAPGIRFGKTAVVPFELCRIVAGQFYKKSLSPDETTAVLNFSKNKPRERLRLIDQGLNILAHDRSWYLNEAGMAISKTPMRVQGRILDAPPILWNSKDSEPQMVVRDGSWNLVDHKFRYPQRIEGWACVNFARASTNDITRFVKKLMTCSEERGMSFRGPPIIVPGTASRDYDKQMAEASRLAREHVQSKSATLVLVVLPEFAPDIRKAVKRFGDVVYGIATQCIRVDKMKRFGGSDQYCNNIALKINARMGGINSVPNLQHQLLGWLSEIPTMVIGADVSHPGPNAHRPSIAALVSSVNSSLSRYVATASVQEPTMEIIQDLERMFQSAWSNFNSYTTVWPKKIIFYRDGVSEGEYETVVREEYKVIKDACKKLVQELSEKGKVISVPEITFIAVGKRHHMRLIPQPGMRTSRGENCPAGLVVDTEIISPNTNDFYLLSHQGQLGTSRPSHYVVLKDDSNFTPDQVQLLSFALCHVYQRATRSVSIPAPVYYADIVCSRGDFHFTPGLNYGNEDVASNATGEFDLQAWVNGWGGIHSNQARMMYFM